MFFKKRGTYPLFKDCNILKFHDKIVIENSIFIHKPFKHKLPQPFDNWFGLSSNFHTHNTRWSNLGCFNVPSHRTKQILAIFTCNYLQNLHRNILFHKLTRKNCIFFYPYYLKDYKLFVQLKLAWNFIFVLFSGTWRGFGGDSIDLHKAFLGCHGGVWKWKFLYWFSAWSNIGIEDLLLI